MITTKVLLPSGLKCLKPKTNFKLYKKNYSRNEFTTWSVLCYPVQPFKLTDIGEGIKEVTVKQWFVKPTQSVRQFDDLCEVESDKASVVLTSRYDGHVKSIYYDEGDMAAVGSILLDIETVDEPIKRETAVEKPERVFKIDDDIKIERISESTNKIEETISIREQVLDDVTAKCLATPAVRRIAKEYNIDINELKGTGKGDRVSKDDILNFINQPQNVPTSPITPTQREIISGYRKAMVKTMTESNKIPTLTFSDEVDVTNLQFVRQRVKSFVQKENVKVTLLSFLVKAVSLSLQKYPILNSILHKDCNEIEYIENHNIGIAIDTERGLIVPNIKNVQNLNIRDIAKQIQRLQNAAVENKLSLHDTSCGTFTISNIGSIGGTVTKPLILPPQVAIVGVGRIQVLPRFDENDHVKKSSIINVSWTADHRIIDGGTIARFSNSVKMYLENPALLIIDA